MHNNREAMTAIALNPRASVVVEACAGSGKTWLLVSRVLRLLLAGAAPSSILAITFTRKAAQEMQERLMQWLAFLATANDTDVRDFLKLRAMTDAEIAEAMPRTRQLFGEVAFAVPRMAVSTFHGWFQQLLSAAPIGLGMSDATIADSESSLLDEAWLNLAESLSRTPESETALALSRLFADWGLSSTRNVLWNFIKRRAEWRAYTRGTLNIATANDADDSPMPSASASHSHSHSDSVIAAALAHWQQEWDVNLAQNPIHDWATNSSVDASIRAIMTAITSTPKMTDAALKWPPVLAFSLSVIEPDAKFSAIRAAFLTQKDEPRVNQCRWAEKAGVMDHFQSVCASIKSAAEAIIDQEIFIYNRDALIAGIALLAAYEKLKADQRTVDFADLEWRAFSLLTDSVHAETMQYRLDQRYRHILLDEFQDTNPIQWQCLTAWLNASVAADSKPTVFMVGDPKQAIYRFRRTDARLFQIAKKYFVDEFDAKVCALNHTRRNAPDIVDFVNAVFAAEPAFEGFQKHAADNTKSVGAVAVLPKFMTHREPIEAIESWESNVELRNPLITPRDDEAEDRFASEAAALALAIKHTVGRVMIEQTSESGMTHRAAQYRDIMVLFRRRAPLTAFEHALRAARIPYVGAKPGGLMAALEVSDMVALLTFLSAPDDDLSLAQVLKSPLFGATDDALISLRFCAIDGAWWQRLQSLALQSDGDVILRQAAPQLRAWLSAMDHLPVHDLLDKIYHEANVLDAYAAAVPYAMRAGVTANLNAFMALALAVDSGRYPSLPRFLSELKRYRALPDQDAPDEGAVLEDNDDSEADTSINAVRLMTIHTSKGLEAPIVFLIDADDITSRADAHTVLCDWQPQDAAPRHFSFWATKALQGARRDTILAEEVRYQTREQLNLLYVAATRAKQYFIMGGSARTKLPEAVSWLDRAAAANLTMKNQQIFPDDTTLVVNADNTRTPSTPSIDATLYFADDVDDLPFEPIGKRATLQPDDSKRELGIEIHALLEARAATSQSFKPANVSASMIARNIAEKILRAEPLQKFFDPAQYVAAFNELEISTTINDKFQLQRIDRLVEFEDEVWVLDYKTGDATDTEMYREQIEMYCHAIVPLHPEKTIRGALINADGMLIVLR